MQTRPTTPLHQILNQKIDHYETQENIAPKSKWEAFKALFKHSGAKGRKRGNAYSEKINAIQTEQELLKMVLFDVLGKGVGLDGSVILRRRVYEGLCEYYKINVSAIDKQIQQIISSMSYSHALASAGYVPNCELIRDKKMLQAIAHKANWPTTLNNKEIKKTQTHSSLHDAINAKIHQYQTEDNQKPKTTLQQFTFLFRHCGFAGRRRAATYKVDVNAMQDEPKLLQKLLNDTLGNGFDLQNSTVLKRRMLEALCLYYKVDMAAFEEAVYHSVQTMVRAYANGNYPVPIDRDAIRDEKLREQVLRVSNWQPSISAEMKLTTR